MDKCGTCGEGLDECVEYSYCVRCLCCEVLQNDTVPNGDGVTVSELPACPLCGGDWGGE